MTSSEKQGLVNKLSLAVALLSARLFHAKLFNSEAAALIEGEQSGEPRRLDRDEFLARTREYLRSI
ncbi:hypothetical protein M8R20_03870 [Pseudomonas sp. R2.Fl]|nr:hypothetical protein [Pseudomonas sp. R2.Fl]